MRQRFESFTVCGCAWIGRGLFERNRPATFEYPVCSPVGDWAMVRDLLTGRIRLQARRAMSVGD